MIEEKFAKGESFIHRLDPVIRIAAATVLSICTAVCDDLGVIWIYVTIALFIIIMARLDIRSVMGRIKAALIVVLMMWLFIPTTFGGEILYQYAFIKISSQGVILCTKISIKSITILLVFISLIATMTVASFGHGLHRLHLPDKMVFLLLMTYRYIFVIEQEYKRLLRAAKFRGFRPGTNIHSYKTHAYLAGMLFVRASLRANRVYQAMICRGFNRQFHTLDIYPPMRSNFIFLLLVVSISAGATIFERIL